MEINMPDEPTEDIGEDMDGSPVDTPDGDDDED